MEKKQTILAGLILLAGALLAILSGLLIAFIPGIPVVLFGGSGLNNPQAGAVSCMFFLLGSGLSVGSLYFSPKLSWPQILAALFLGISITATLFSMPGFIRLLLG